MNRLKTNTSQTKIKPKIPVPSPSNKKSISKTKEKTERVSPRANRIHTLQAKKTMDFLKRPNLHIQIEPTKKDQHLITKQVNKGYETPKFKWEIENVSQSKKGIALHNFFSFGEMQLEKQSVKRKIERERERDKQNRIKKQVRERISRKEHLIR